MSERFKFDNPEPAERLSIEQVEAVKLNNRFRELYGDDLNPEDVSVIALAKVLEMIQKMPTEDAVKILDQIEEEIKKSASSVRDMRIKSLLKNSK